MPITKPDIFLGISLLLFIPMIPIQAYADFGSRQNLYFYIVVLIFIAAMIDHLLNLISLSKTYKDVVMLIITCCLIFFQLSDGITFTFFTDPKINPETLNYFDGYTSTAEWINENVKPDEKILALLRDANILHILTTGNRTILDINTCIGDVSFVPAKSCAPPYITFWVYKGTTDPDNPRDSILGISEPAFISSIRQNDVKYIIISPKIYYLYYYLKVHPDFEEVAQLSYNVIFRVIYPVQPIANFPDIKWENCIGKGTPEYLWNLNQTYPARYEMMLKTRFGPWMGLSKQDMSNVLNWKGCEFDPIYPGEYALP